jgi:hypothetical protein
MANIDMYTYLLTAQQPPLPPPPKPNPAPPQPNPNAFPTRAQARAKARKEKEELRAWWDDLPEEKRQQVRDTRIPSDPPKPKKDKKDSGKKKPEQKKEQKKPDPLDPQVFLHLTHRPAPPQPESKPDLASVLEVRTWAIADM